MWPLEMWCKYQLGFQPPGLRLPCSSSAPGMFLSCAREKPNPFVSMELSSQSFSGVNTAELEPHRAINQMELCHQREDGLKGDSSLLPFPALVLLSHLPKKGFVGFVFHSLFSPPLLLWSHLVPQRLWKPWELEKSSAELGGVQDIRTVLSSCANPKRGAATAPNLQILQEWIPLKEILTSDSSC